MDRLPTELLKPIFSNLEEWELYPVICTCRAFAQAAKAILYDDLSLTLYYSVFKNNPALYDNFIKPRPSGHTEEPLVTPTGFSSNEAKIFGLFKLLKHASESPDGKFLSRLSLVNFNDVGSQAAKRFDFMPLVSKLFDNCSEQKLTKLAIPLDWVKLAVRFEGLRELQVETTPACFKRNLLPDNLQFPALTWLAISWREETQDARQFSLPGFMAVVATLLCRFTTIKRLTIAGYSNDNVDSRADRHILDHKACQIVYTVFENLILPNLEDFQIQLRSMTMFLSVLLNRDESGDTIAGVLGRQGHLSFYNLFNKLVSRHKGQMKRIDWRGGLSQTFGDTPQFHDTIPKFLNLEVLKIAIHGSQRSDELPDLDWCDQLAVNEDCRSSLKHLEIQPQLYLCSDFLTWLPGFMLKFSNLVEVRLVNVVTSISKIQMLAGTSNFLVGVFGVPNEVNILISHILGQLSQRNLTPSIKEKLAKILPASLRTLSVIVLSTDATTPAVLRRAKRRVSVLFEELPSLTSVDFEIRCDMVEVDITDRSFDSLHIRRRPSNYMNAHDGKKKICVWRTELVHSVINPADECSGHRVLSGYYEYNLKLGVNYKGADAERWSYTTGDLSMIRACRTQGRGGCDHLMGNKGYWAARAHE